MTIDRTLLLFLIGHLAAHANPKYPIPAGLIAMAFSYACAALVSKLTRCPKESNDTQNVG